VNSEKEVNKLKSGLKGEVYLPSRPDPALKNGQDGLTQIYELFHRVGADLTYIDGLREEWELGNVCFELAKAGIPEQNIELITEWPFGCGRMTPGRLLLGRYWNVMLPPESRKILEEKFYCDTLDEFLTTMYRVRFGELGKRTGRPADCWGTFFVLAVSAHLYEITGKQRQATALQLLRAMQHQKPEKPDLASDRAKARLYQFKQRYLFGWISRPDSPWETELEDTKERYRVESALRDDLKRLLTARGQTVPSPWYPSWAPFDNPIPFENGRLCG